MRCRWTRAWLACAVALLSWAGCSVKVGGVEAPSGNFPCETAEECPRSKKPCLLAACMDEQCVFVPAPAAVLPDEDQRVGDCKMLSCDGDGEVIVEPVETDVPREDKNPCTEASCDGDKPHQAPRTAGYKCGADGICNGAGKCGVCMPGERRCDGAATEACTKDGKWGSRAVCPIGKPLCTAANCVGVADAEVGDLHACARFDDGTVRCWGDDAVGQLGQGEPFAPSWISGFPTVSFGRRHACGRRNDGSIWCWGDNGYGQLGDGGYDFSFAPVSTGLTALGVAVGDSVSCALVDGGAVKCWGRNDHGQVGGGAAPAEPFADVDEEGGSAQPLPALLPDIADARGLSLAPFHTCILRGNGATSCWGLESYASPEPIEPPTDGSDPLAAVKKASQPQAKPVTGLQGAAEVACGGQHCCARMADGTARCWGANARGQLGDGTTTDRFKPVVVAGLTNARHIALGRNFACALLGDGSVACWGDNQTGQLGTGSAKPSDRAVTIATLGKAKKLLVGGAFACALLETGELQCWGDGASGQLGREGVDQARQPGAVPWQ